MVTNEFHFGAIVKMNFDPHAGHEQAGWRRGIIVSNDVFNMTNNLRWVCPITHTNRNSPYHIEVKGCNETDGYVMCDQIKALDLRARNARFVEDATDELITEVSALVRDCL